MLAHNVTMYQSVCYGQVRPYIQKLSFACDGEPTYCYLMMTSSNENIFRVTGHLCGEFTGPRWIPYTKASDAELWCFLWYARINGWVNNREAGDLRRYPAHCDVTVMLKFISCQFGRVIFSKIVLAIIKQSVIQKIFWQLYENNSFRSVIHKILWQLYENNSFKYI